jgi:hypothetical protein
LWFDYPPDEGSDRDGGAGGEEDPDSWLHSIGQFDDDEENSGQLDLTDLQDSLPAEALVALQIHLDEKERTSE